MKYGFNTSFCCSRKIKEEFSRRFLNPNLKNFEVPYFNRQEC